MSRVTVIEDNNDLREEVVFHLRHAGHEAVGVADATALDRSLATDPLPDVVVLDIGLPGEDGFSIATRLRRDHPGVGIVMLTARGLIDDKLHGLSLGADAYLVKPVDLRELVAVVVSVGRRLGPRAGGDGGWQLDTTRREVVSPRGVQSALTNTEYLLMLQLAQAAPDVASRRALVEALGHDFLQFDERRIEAAISRLRKKLQDEGEESPLRSARTQGYVFAAPIRIVSSN